ncbi:MAG TPA: ABC-F family ATP-binding cassette domain-containing protein, partial [Acidimicrobiales bacterium]|nr:ABC-F family ATP-binding cassette domain-containing protein [Acidimicrobiales bacterium]
TGWEAEAALDRLGMGSLAGAEVATLSGGQAKRVALARTLVQPAELLVLDEPTNHLDLGAVRWLEDRLAAHRGGLVLVTHDRHLLDRVTTRMVELDRGTGYVHEGGYASYLEARAERDERAAEGETVRRNLARREAAWLRRGAPARSRKPQARVDAAKALIEARPQAAARRGELDLAVTGTPRLGDKVIEVRSAAAGHDPSRPVLVQVDLDLDRRERLGVVGANGAGKTTLLELLAGRLAPVAGSVEVGPTVRLGVYDQHGAELDPDARVREVVAGPTRAPGAPEDAVLMERFWFTGDLPWARVATLSGGERRRLQLLALLATRPNVLLLDEPTNDLDLDTLRVLEDFLDDWPGALVVVSHDRALLERTVERVVAVGGDGVVRPVPGGVAGWLAGGAVTQAAAPTAGDTAPAGGATPAGAGTGGDDAPAVGLAGINRPGGGPAPSPPGQQGSPRGPSASTLGRRLREVEKVMGRLERRRDELTEALGSTADHVALARIGAELAEVTGELDANEELWLDLAAQAEQTRR